MGALAKLRSLFHRKGWNGDPWAPVSQPWNVWQMFPSAGRADAGSYGPVYACWAILAQEVSRIPLKHLVFDDDGAATPVYNRAPARVLRVPNAYQTRSDFLMYLMRSLLSEGNAYARVTRNNRFEISALYPLNPRQCRPYKDPQTGDIYYQLSTGDEKDPVWVPARDMLHIRLFTPTDPLIGETPLVAAALTVQAGTAINGQVASFFGNMARPSGIIRHPGTLQPDAIQRIKTRFKEASSNINAGDPIVFTEGMEWESLTMSAVDAELIASARFSQTQIAQIYRVPPFMLGDMEQAKFASVEAMTRWFVNSGLGFYLDHISDSLTKLFELPAGEEIEFDYEAALFRSDFKEFMLALEVGTRSGVLSPNEARKMRRLPPVEDGDDPRVQQQLVPLSYGAEMQPPANTSTAPTTPETPDAPDTPEPAPDEEEAKAVRIELMRRRMLGVTA